MTTEATFNGPNSGGLSIISERTSQVGLPVVRSHRLGKSLEKARKSLAYQTEYVKETFSDELWQAMEHRALTQSAFALKAGVPKQFLTRVFRGGNCTIETMVKLGFALNYKVHVHLTPNEVGCGWIHCITDNAPPRPPSRFIDLWTDSGYKPIALLKKEVKA